MVSSRGICVTVSIASLLALCGQAAGSLTPQQGLPGEWRIEGYIDMWAESINPTNAKIPFGIDPSMASDGVVDFSAGIIAAFDAPDAEGDGKADDGLYDATVEHLRRNNARQHSVPGARRAGDGYQRDLHDDDARPPGRVVRVAHFARHVGGAGRARRCEPRHDRGDVLAAGRRCRPGTGGPRPDRAGVAGGEEKADVGQDNRNKVTPVRDHM